MESSLLDALRSHFARLRPCVIRPARGCLKHDYLVCGGYYTEQWDWDGFFIGVHLCNRPFEQPQSGRPAQERYLRNWCLNFLEAADGDGCVPGCISERGPEPGHRAFQMKPFLAQGACLASDSAREWTWLLPHYAALKRIVLRRERTNFDAGHGLFYWDNAMQSGADNNPALSNEPAENGAFLACDVNTWQLREYLALRRIASELDHPHDAARFGEQAAALSAAIARYLWSAEDATYWNRRRDTGPFVHRVSFSNFIPLVQRLASPAGGREMIARYLWNEEHLRGRFGLRTVSRQDPAYNNVNMIWPYSNWQGPVWPIANYLYFRALMNYGFRAEARDLAEMIARLCLADLERSGSMHENYDAETGAPLAPAAHQAPRFIEGQFVGWNLLVENMLEEAASGGDALSLEAATGAREPEGGQ